MPDGCGGTLQCGTCDEGGSCGGSGLANVCGSPPPPNEDPLPEPEPEPDPQECGRNPCEEMHSECGWEYDSCGNKFYCGTCREGTVCGAFMYNMCEPCASEPLPTELPLVHTGKLGADAVRLNWMSPLRSGGVYTIRAVGPAGPLPLTVHAQPCDSRDTLALGPLPGRPDVYAVGFGITAYIRIGSDDASIGKDYRLRISRWYESELGLCRDGLDNDEDGTVDCDDGECGQRPECLEQQAPP